MVTTRVRKILLENLLQTALIQFSLSSFVLIIDDVFISLSLIVTGTKATDLRTRARLSHRRTQVKLVIRKTVSFACLDLVA